MATAEKLEVIYYDGTISIYRTPGSDYPLLRPIERATKRFLVDKPSKLRNKMYSIQQDNICARLFNSMHEAKMFCKITGISSDTIYTVYNGKYAYDTITKISIQG